MNAWQLHHFPWPLPSIFNNFTGNLFLKKLHVTKRNNISGVRVNGTFSQSCKRWLFVDEIINPSNNSPLARNTDHILIFWRFIAWIVFFFVLFGQGCVLCCSNSSKPDFSSLNALCERETKSTVRRVCVGLSSENLLLQMPAGFRLLRLFCVLPTLIESEQHWKKCSFLLIDFCLPSPVRFLSGRIMFSTFSN